MSLAPRSYNVTPEDVKSEGFERLEGFRYRKAILYIQITQKAKLFYTRIAEDQTDVMKREIVE